MFYFAEMVLLPCPVIEPGQLYFLPGLKVDIFGVHNSIGGATSVFGLPEGHLLIAKTANTVLSMLHHAIDTGFSPMNSDRFVRGLCPHADNYSGPRKIYMFFGTFVGSNGV